MASCVPGTAQYLSQYVSYRTGNKLQQQQSPWCGISAAERGAASMGRNYSHIYRHKPVGQNHRSDTNVLVLVLFRFCGRSGGNPDFG